MKDRFSSYVMSSVTEKSCDWFWTSMYGSMLMFFLLFFFVCVGGGRGGGEGLRSVLWQSSCHALLSMIFDAVKFVFCSSCCYFISFINLK